MLHVEYSAFLLDASFEIACIYFVFDALLFPEDTFTVFRVNWLIVLSRAAALAGVDHIKLMAAQPSRTLYAR